MVNINEHHSTFLRGRNPLNFDEDNLDHPLNIEWYKEQQERCMLGYEHSGTRLTANHYFYLNFVPILKLKEDEFGNPIGVREIEYPLWCQADDYVFKQIEEAIFDDKDVMLFSGRGWGKSFLSISFALYNYILIENSESIISASNKKLVDACFVDKVIPCLAELEKRHLTWKQKRLTDTLSIVKAGESIDTGTDKFKRGTGSSIEKIIYNTEGETAGRRVNFHLYEECIGEDVNVIMYDLSLKRAGDLMLGDKLLGIDGQPKEIGYLKHNKGNLYEIIPKRGKPFIVNENHVLHLEQKTKDGRVLVNKNLNELFKYKSSTLRMNYKLRRTSEIEFDKQDLPLDPYFLGVWLGDGNKQYEKELTIVVNEKDVEISNYLHKFIEDYPNLYCRVKDIKGKVYTEGNLCKHYKLIFKKDYKRTGIEKNPIKVKLTQLGLYNEVRIPKIYLQSSLTQRLELLAGIIDTDGCVSRTINTNKDVSSYTCIIEMSREKLIDDICFLASSCGLYTNKMITVKEQGVYYQLYISGDLHKIPMKIERKKAFLPKKIKQHNSLVTSFKIKEVGHGNYVSFTLKGDKPEDNLFLLEDFIVTHNCGEWGKNPSLKDCINNTRGTSMVGSIKMEGLTMYIGTGGSVASDQAREIMFNPETFNLYVVNPYEQRKHSIFMPVYTKFSGYYEKTGVCDEEGVKKYIQEQRKIRENDISTLTKYIQQFPLTIEEVFMKNTTKVFNSMDLAKQHTYITQKILKEGEDYDMLVGDLEFTENMKAVVFRPNPHGKFRFTELPEGYDEKKPIDSKVPKNLYCIGVDSIDMGNDDSADSTGKNRSKLALLVKKRISPTNPLSNIYNNSYVCMYLNRADDVEDDYENVLKASIFYNAQIMLEYTRTNIKTYFKRYKQDWRFCKRPDVGSNNMEESDSTIGFKATEVIIKHYISCIKHYLKETSCKTIFFEELLEQLVNYDYEDKGKFDLIAAMGGCELHDEQLTINHVVARNTNNKMQLLTYKDGILGVHQHNKINYNEHHGILDYIDAETGKMVYK